MLRSVQLGYAGDLIRPHSIDNDGIPFSHVCKQSYNQYKAPNLPIVILVLVSFSQLWGYELVALQALIKLNHQAAHIDTTYRYTNLLLLYKRSYMIKKSAPEIVKAYFEALSTGDKNQLSGFLSEDFKEIGARLETHNKLAYLESVRTLHAGAPVAKYTILNMETVGNVVKVVYKNQGHNISSPPKCCVFSIADEKIMLGVQIAPD